MFKVESTNNPSNALGAMYCRASKRAMVKMSSPTVSSRSEKTSAGIEVKAGKYCMEKLFNAELGAVILKPRKGCGEIVDRWSL